jgi:FtsZ-binding cell division protein ZapB
MIKKGLRVLLTYIIIGMILILTEPILQSSQIMDIPQTLTGLLQKKTEEILLLRQEIQELKNQLASLKTDFRNEKRASETIQFFIDKRGDILKEIENKTNDNPFCINKRHLQYVWLSICKNVDELVTDEKIEQVRKDYRLADYVNRDYLKNYLYCWIANETGFHPNNPKRCPNNSIDLTISHINSVNKHLWLKLPKNLINRPDSDVDKRTRLLVEWWIERTSLKWTWMTIDRDRGWALFVRINNL